MNPQRVDLVVDITYGLLIFLAIILLLRVGTQTGVAFGVGVLLSYLVHVVWKMSRFDPDWMTSEVADVVEQSVEETVDEEVGDTVEQEVAESVEKSVGETVESEVARTVEEAVEDTVGDTVEASVSDSVEETVSDTVEEAIDEKVDAEVADTVEQAVGEKVDEEVADTVEQTVSEEVSAVIEKLESINERVDRRPRTEEVEATVEEKTAAITAEGDASEGRENGNSNSNDSAAEPTDQ
jgi:uncharacterized membrane-anchored protein YjiN (DUF445 family)